MKLETVRISKKYGSRDVVKQVSLEISRGEIVGLLGPNGAGKTTFFNSIVGLVKPNSGKVFLNNNDITKLPMYKRARKGMGYLPQEPSIFTGLSVKENILSVLEMMGNNKNRKNIFCFRDDGK